MLIESSISPLRSSYTLAFRLVVDGGQVQNLHLAVAVRCDHDGRCSPLPFLFEAGGARPIGELVEILPAGHNLILRLVTSFVFRLSAIPWNCHTPGRSNPGPTLSLGMLSMFDKSKAPPYAHPN